MEDGPARRVGLCPKASSNRFDNGPADRQTIEAIGLRTKEWLKKFRPIARRQAAAVIGHAEMDRSPVASGADRNFAGLAAWPLNRLTCVFKQVDQDLLNLNAIGVENPCFRREIEVNQDLATAGIRSTRLSASSTRGRTSWRAIRGGVLRPKSRRRSMISQARSAC